VVSGEPGAPGFAGFRVDLWGVGHGGGMYRDIGGS
jgi:hypothetical protein